MAKIVKRKKKKTLRLESFTAVFVLFSAMLYLLSALFLRSYNNLLSTQTQEINDQIAALTLQNDALKLENKELASSERVDEIAANSGLTRNQENIITITSEDIDGE
jgi:cell division protein FtsL